MLSYSDREVFSAQEVQLLRQAESIVKLLPDQVASQDLRCHEVVRIVAQTLDLNPAQIQDGYYGFVDHSWLRTEPLNATKIVTPRIGLPNILDVYCVGSLPQVRLVDCQHTSLPHVGWAYRPSKVRDDIRVVQIAEAVKYISGNFTPRKN